ncbi:MAG: hypothetical protein GXP54_10220, partial [Deltaproteobacteria bacterium]|nr:hypothetical protein [Deltaproteobacteria bacterium]
KAVMAGVAPDIVDDASVSEILPVGTLAMMDSIGLDTVHAAVIQYTARMPEAEAQALTPLREGLKVLVDMGKHGAKNRDGILRGRPLPWTLDDPPELDPGFTNRIAALFRETCEAFVREGLMDRGSLGLVLDGLLGVTAPWVQEVGP